MKQGRCRGSKKRGVEPGKQEGRASGGSAPEEWGRGPHAEVRLNKEQGWWFC